MSGLVIEHNTYVQEEVYIWMEMVYVNNIPNDGKTISTFLTSQNYTNITSSLTDDH